jgi:hypothetical protein
VNVGGDKVASTGPNAMTKQQAHPTSPGTPQDEAPRDDHHQAEPNENLTPSVPVTMLPCGVAGGWTRRARFGCPHPRRAITPELVKHLTARHTRPGEGIAMPLPQGITSAVCDGVEALAQAAGAGHPAIGLIPHTRDLHAVTTYAQTLSQRTPRRRITIRPCAPTQIHQALASLTAPALIIVVVPFLAQHDDWPDVVETFGSARDALRPGGKLAVVTPSCCSGQPGGADEIVLPAGRVLQLRLTARHLTVHTDPVSGELTGHAQVWLFSTPEAAGA